MRGVTTEKNAIREAIEFQLTRLMRGVTGLPVTRVTGTDISTHTPHARRDQLQSVQYYLIFISTHTPHARRDFATFCEDTDHANFNSHASCEA